MRILCLLLTLLAARVDAATSVINFTKGTGATSAGNTVYGAIVSGSSGFTANAALTESYNVFPVATAGTFKWLRAKVNSNSTTANSTITFRKSSGCSFPPTMADGNQVVTIASTDTSGWITQATHGTENQDHVNAGDCVGVKFVAGTGGSIAVIELAIAFTPDDPSKTWTKIGAFTEITFSSSGASVYYQTIMSIAQTNASRAETDLQYKMPVGASFGPACLNVRTNTFTADGSFTVRVNAANAASGSKTITNNTGTNVAAQYCTSAADAVSSGDLIAYALVPASSSSGQLITQSWAADVVTTDNSSLWGFQATGGLLVGALSTTYCSAIGSNCGSQGAFAADALVNSTSINSGYVNVITNSTTSGSNTFEIWKNNASTGMTATVPSGSGNVGQFAFSGGPVSANAGDLIEVKCTAASGTSITFEGYSLGVTTPATPTTRIRHSVRGSDE